MPLLASSTQERYGGVLKNYLMPTLGDRCLRELTPVVLQQYISGFKIKDASGQKTEAAAEKGMTDALERESVDKIRDVLSSSLGSAVKYGYLVSNPAAGLKLRPNKRGKRRQKPFIRPDQLTALLELIAEPYATMIYVAVYTGLRVSELIGLRWNDIHDNSITIDERYCRGDWENQKVMPQIQPSP
jgi:integrase